MQPRIKINTELPVGEQTIPDQSTQSFTFAIVVVSHLLVKNYKGKGVGGLIERGAY